MTRAGWVEVFAHSTAQRIADTLRIDRGQVLSTIDLDRVQGVIEHEVAKLIAPPGEAARIVREGFRAGLTSAATRRERKGNI